jgi:hypothetical protein
MFQSILSVELFADDVLVLHQTYVDGVLAGTGLSGRP